MPKEARAAREQPSPGPTPSVNAPVAGGMAWAAQLHAVMSSMLGQQLCRRLEVQPGSFLRIRLSWLLCVHNRQALLVVEPLLLLFLLLEAVPMKPPPLDPLSTKGTRAW